MPLLVLEQGAVARYRHAHENCSALRYLRRLWHQQTHSVFADRSIASHHLEDTDPCLRNPKEITVVRQFQSETETIREAPQPWFAKATVWALTGVILLTIAGMSLTRIDRVISGSGKVVPTRSLNVYQALDTSIIRDDRCSRRRRSRQGSTISVARSDICGGRRQATAPADHWAGSADRARPGAADNKPLVFADSTDPDVLKYQAMNQSYFDQQIAQYKAQLAEF